MTCLGLHYTIFDTGGEDADYFTHTPKRMHCNGSMLFFSAPDETAEPMIQRLSCLINQTYTSPF